MTQSIIHSLIGLEVVEGKSAPMREQRFGHMTQQARAVKKKILISHFYD